MVHLVFSGNGVRSMEPTASRTSPVRWIASGRIMVKQSNTGKESQGNKKEGNVLRIGCALDAA